jgi:hypothetical protein
MLFGVIVGLAAAWFLTMFQIDKLLIEGITELFGKEIGISGYYTIFAFIGLIGGAFKHRR